ncbi:3-phosphoserine/phosphohydroxythreonine aminotransferase [Catenovulum agarivorans DS-2]|uniref:Phosphoserine aminotransferase n=1 Tax=Catenovulum agarivorans DS-2 TaxID=1328313 RepID=W7QL77_9ALTE|nr:3-phosphoserine/phosphohydroxythreonine transaminase [Catenovulum agarivorans]EWH08893.1 3-phosphoserine/phosphohydroxythreonine aminotransferase [Catenovulum agarivorans DS-2]
MTKEVFNFCAGPAMLPKPVMQLAQQELVNWNDMGVSVMEISHRSKDYIAVAEQAEKDLRDLMGISDDYSVLFMHGGGRGQFAAVPMNLLTAQQQADYVLTGSWSKSAFTEGQKYGQINLAADTYTNEKGEGSILPFDQWKLSESAEYVHYCPNETVDGIEFNYIPEVDKPLVADMSSCILSQEIDVSKFGVIYAGAQKNIGPSGLAIAIVRKDLIGRANGFTPSIYDYAVQNNSDSMFNTPPTYAWYLAGLVFKWLKSQGGVAAVQKVNEQKAALLYNFIDGNEFYSNKVEKQYRSKMNVPFFLENEALNAKFLAESEQAGLLALKGHRSVGGMRASIYNAMPLEGVEALVAFMQDFAQKNG